jgi:hypothetical protein
MEPDYKLSPEHVNPLQVLIGSELNALYAEGGTLSLGDGLVLDGWGTLSLAFRKENTHYKWRLKFHSEAGAQHDSGLLTIEENLSLKECYDPQTAQFDYDRIATEDPAKFHIQLGLGTRKDELFPAVTQVRSIRIYNYVYEGNPGEPFNQVDKLALIVLETEANRQLVVEVSEPALSFYVYLDVPEFLEERLDERHDDPGPTFGKPRYQLQYAFS